MSIIARYPVLSYLVLCYSITWTVWFSVPLAAGREWALIKIFVAVGMGPGLAAVLLDRARGTAGPIDTTWWRRFAAVFAVVAATTISGLVTGDAPAAAELQGARPAGLTFIGLAGCLMAAAVCAFTFAAAAGSQTPALHSITRWRVPLRWWFAAALLIGVLLLVSLGIALMMDEEIRYTAGPPWFLIRALLFTLFVVGIGEETGWRGWMQPELQKRYSPLTTSVLIGIAWGLWHFPLWVIGAYPGSPDAVIEYLVIGPLLSILFTWIWNGTNGSLLLMIVLHTGINNWPRVIPAAGPFKLLLIAVVIGAVIQQKMWRRRGAAT